MNKAKDHLDAVRKVVNTLEQFDSRTREQILRWASEELNVSFTLNPLGLQFMVFRESIAQVEENKKYWLSRMKETNEISEAISDYMKEINDALLHLQGSKKKKAKMKLRNFKIEDDDEATTIQPSVVELTANELNKEISKIESDRETVRNKRQLATTQFENFDQKANQLFNILSSVMKAIKEMSSAVTRNML